MLLILFQFSVPLKIFYDCSTRLSNTKFPTLPGLNSSFAISCQVFSRVKMFFRDGSNQQYKCPCGCTNSISFSSSSVVHPAAFNGIFNSINYSLRHKIKTKCRLPITNENSRAAQHDVINYARLLL